MLENLGVQKTAVSDLRKYPVFYCPKINPSDMVCDRPGYLLNDHVFGYFNVNTGVITCPPLQVFKTKQPSDVSMAMCGKEDRGSYSKWYFRIGDVGWNNHDGSCNMLHCDGHAESHRFIPNYGAAPQILGTYQDIPLINTYNP
jgi:prepilin-type processing-associated H-X9-DG protein